MPIPETFELLGPLQGVRRHVYSKVDRTKLATYSFSPIVKTAIQLFGVVLGGALLSAFLGGLFAMIIAMVSPHFVSSLFGIKEHPEVTRYAFSVGMIWGLFIGAAVAGFACRLAALLRILKLWSKVD